MTQFVEKPTILSLKVKIPASNRNPFAEWQAEMNEVIVGQPGFISLEFVSPTNSPEDWAIVQRFSNVENTTLWKESPKYQELITTLKSLSVSNTFEEKNTDESSVNQNVTEVIVAEVFPDKEKKYREWIAKIHLKEAKLSGFRGVYVQSPNESGGKFWITLLQFDTMQNLDRWLNSSERIQLLEESKSLISYIETHRVMSPFAGWFGSIAKVGEVPPLWKQTMIILLVLFPIVMLEIMYLNPFLNDLNISLRTFIGNAISVSLISFPAVPLAIYFLGWWLSPNPKYRKCATIVGTIVVVALYLIEIIIFWGKE